MNEPKTDLYADLCAAGCEVDHHESDLYVKNSPEAREIIAAHGARGKMFQSEGRTWYEFPFAYTPFWAAKEAAK